MSLNKPQYINDRLLILTLAAMHTLGPTSINLAIAIAECEIPNWERTGYDSFSELSTQNMHATLVQLC